MKHAGVLHGHWAATQRRRRTYAETTLLHNSGAVEAGKVPRFPFAGVKPPDQQARR